MRKNDSAPRNYVKLITDYRMRAIIHNPTRLNDRLGSQAASQGGKYPPVPSASPNCCRTKYTKQITRLLATPTKAFRLPEAAPNGVAINTTTRHVQGKARRPCNLVYNHAFTEDGGWGCNR